MAACVEAGGSITGEHGVGSDKIDYMPLIFDADTLARHARGPPGLRSRGAGESRQGRAGPRLPRVAGDAGRPMSDVVFGRLRALLGTGGVERDAAGLPRATPDSADALSLVCRLAHDEGWKIRVEGHGTWLPADAPADLAVSTRALDRVLSVSPADLVATVQAGTPLEALRRRLADEGMWLGHRSAGPAGAEPRLGASPPAPPARCVTASARCATTCSAAPSRPATGGWSAPAGGW